MRLLDTDEWSALNPYMPEAGERRFIRKPFETWRTKRLEVSLKKWLHHFDVISFELFDKWISGMIFADL